MTAKKPGRASQKKATKPVAQPSSASSNSQIELSLLAQPPARNAPTSGESFRPEPGVQRDVAAPGVVVAHPAGCQTLGDGVTAGETVPTSDMGIPFCARCGAATRELCKCGWKFVPLTPAAWREEVAERAAIIEHMGNQPRAEADRLALLEVGPCPGGRP